MRDEEDTPDTADRGGLEWHAPSSYMYIHICDWMYTHVHIHIQRGGISLSLSLSLSIGMPAVIRAVMPRGQRAGRGLRERQTTSLLWGVNYAKQEGTVSLPHEAYHIQHCTLQRAATRTQHCTSSHAYNTITHTTLHVATGTHTAHTLRLACSNQLSPVWRALRCYSPHIGHTNTHSLEFEHAVAHAVARALRPARG